MARINRLIRADKSAEAESAAPSRPSRAEGARRDLFQEVTDRIVTAIESGGALPWSCSWDAAARWPINPTTGRPYHGINVLALLVEGFQDPRWCSYKQAQAKGWQVRKGEKGTDIFFYKMMVRPTGEIDEETGDEKVFRIPFLRASRVFNLSQIDNAPEFDFGKPVTEMSAEAVAACDEIIEAAAPEIQSGSRRAAYSPSQDKIFMPHKESFKTDGDYYATKMHEIGHWTGHESRLNRVFGKDRASPEYAAEELRAEISSAMLSMRLGIPSSIPEHAGYVESYLRILKNDKKAIFKAAADAEKITRYVLSFHPEYRKEFEEEHRQRLADAVAAGAPEEIFDASSFEFEEEEDVPAMRATA